METTTNPTPEAPANEAQALQAVAAGEVAGAAQDAASADPLTEVREALDVARGYPALGPVCTVLDRLLVVLPVVAVAGVTR